MCVRSTTSTVRRILSLRFGAKKEKCVHGPYKDYFCQITIIWFTRIAPWISVGWIYFTRVLPPDVFEGNSSLLGPAASVIYYLLTHYFFEKLSSISRKYILAVFRKHGDFFSGGGGTLDQLLHTYIYIFKANRISEPNFNSKDTWYKSSFKIFKFVRYIS